MAVPPVRERGTAANDELPRRRDGSQAWLGLLITVVAVLLAAALLGAAACRWLR